MAATKQNFIDLLRAKLVTKYDWAKDPARLDVFMEKVRITLTTDRSPVDMLSGVTIKEVWKEIGCKGKLTYKALRALPEG
jgi:hypothetical protein